MDLNSVFLPVDQLLSIMTRKPTHKPNCIALWGVSRLFVERFYLRYVARSLDIVLCHHQRRFVALSVQMPKLTELERAQPTVALLYNDFLLTTLLLRFMSYCPSLGTPVLCRDAPNARMTKSKNFTKNKKDKKNQKEVPVFTLCLTFKPWIFF